MVPGRDSQHIVKAAISQVSISSLLCIFLERKERIVTHLSLQCIAPVDILLDFSINLVLLTDSESSKASVRVTTSIVACFCQGCHCLQ